MRLKHCKEYSDNSGGGGEGGRGEGGVEVRWLRNLVCYLKVGG